MGHLNLFYGCVRWEPSVVCHAKLWTSGVVRLQRGFREWSTGTLAPPTPPTALLSESVPGSRNRRNRNWGGDFPRSWSVNIALTNVRRNHISFLTRFSNAKLKARAFHLSLFLHVVLVVSSGSHYEQPWREKNYIYLYIYLKKGKLKEVWGMGGGGGLKTLTRI